MVFRGDRIKYRSQDECHRDPMEQNAEVFTILENYGNKSNKDSG